MTTAAMQNEEVGLFEFSYDLGEKGEWLVTLMRGEQLDLECHNPAHDHSKDPRYSCNMVVRDGEQRIVYDTSPNLIMPYTANELLVFAGLLMMSDQIEASFAVVRLRKQMGDVVDTFIQGLAETLGFREGVSFLTLDEMKRVVSHGEDIFRIIAIARERGMEATTPEEKTAVFGKPEVPKVEYRGVNEKFVSELLDED